MSRLVKLAALAGIMVSGFTLPAMSAQSPGPIAHAAPMTMPVIQADHRCGPGRHFVPRHRWHGRWVHPYCARNFRHHPPGY
jgi:hypothetical protein